MTTPGNSSHRVSAFADDALGSDDAVEIRRRLAAGEVSCTQIVSAAIERARAAGPALNAIAHERFDRALEEARGNNHGAFGGIPTFVKDTDAVEGLPLRMGSHALPDAPQPKSSQFVKQLLGTGLICLGKTTLPELGLTATTESLAYGPTCNPWNTAHSTGGSSGGSAALVAAGVVPLAHANDGGGSIRIPASCCGLVGLKPSRARLVGADGGRLFPIDIISQGVVTRSVRDTAAFLAAAEQVKPSRRYAPVGMVEGAGGKGLRIACFTDSAHGVESHPDCTRAVVETAELCESLGHHVDRIRCPYDEHVVDDFFAYWGFAPFGLGLVGRWVFGPGYDHSRIDAWSHGLAEQFRRNIWRMPGVLRRLRSFAQRYDAFFARYDVLLSPTLAEPPMPLGYISPDIPFATAVERVMRYAAFTPVQNLSGGAAISLPLGRSADDLPIGVQLGGDRGSERRLLELAYALEEARPWPTLAGNSH
ncbi:MAG TPA: amidase [Candidatus Limnocylindrales bacterium]|nr:amidase [Candidatus Limnocylindrales bacterium]